jgi:hypothetical protein
VTTVVVTDFLLWFEQQDDIAPQPAKPTAQIAEMSSA